MRNVLPIVLCLAATPALSQTCDAPIGPIETCLVGAWVGTSTIPEALERAMASMPDNIRANFQEIGALAAMIIYDDGFFETFPIAASGVAAFRDADGDVTTFQINGQTTTTVGYISALGGTLDLCYLPGAMGNLRGEMTVSTSGGDTTVPLLAVPDSSFNPVISYTCSGDRMTQTVALPAPLGAITYDLSRVPREMFEEALTSWVDSTPAE